MDQIANVTKQATVYFKCGRLQNTALYLLERLSSGTSILGPAIIIDKTQTLVIIHGAQARIFTLHIVIEINALKTMNATACLKVDPIQLAVFKHRFISIAEQMGRTLQKTAVSLNIKE